MRQAAEEQRYYKIAVVPSNFSFSLEKRKFWYLKSTVVFLRIKKKKKSTCMCFCDTGLIRLI
jgi:hypothetical protein